MSLDFLYTAISWVMLRWHDLWDAVGLGNKEFLGTNWDWVLSIVFLVITVRVVLFPLYVKQIKSQRAMQALQPKIKELQAKYKNGDKQAMQQELMELYRKEKANPLMGCLPLALQAPVLLSLFHVLRHLSHPNYGPPYSTLYGWTNEEYHSASAARLFTAPIAAALKNSSDIQQQLHASTLSIWIVGGLLVAIMIATTFLTQRQMIARTGWATDPQQKTIQRVMLYGVPVMLLFSGIYFPIGVVIYWTTSNLFSLGQQSWILHKYPPPPNAAKAAADAGKPLKGKAAEEARKVQEERTARAKALAPKPGAKPTKQAAKKVGTKTAPAKKAEDSAAGASAGSNGQPAKKAAAKKAATKKAAPRTNGTKVSDTSSDQAVKRKAGS